MSDEAACLYVSSRGLMKSCDVRPPHPSSSTRVCYDYDWASLAPGAVVYVNSSAIPDFLTRAWPRVRVPIVLVSGDCDETVPDDLFPDEAALRTLLEDGRLLAWFAQNAAPHHPKIHQIPIGLDYHTLSVNETHPWGPKQSPAQQEQILSLLKARTAFVNRKQTAHANFHFSMRTRFAHDRRDALRHLDQSLVVYEEAPTARFVTWLNQTGHRFVVSPQGGGVDCHRTWEALCLGCIPIVKTSWLDPLFEGLPVLIVKSWDSVTPALLDQCVERYLLAPPDQTKLTLAYWVQRIRSKVPPIGAHLATPRAETAE